jgi:hypothetical protein
VLRYIGAVRIPFGVPLRGLERMADENRDEELPQRVKGAVRRGPARSGPSSALSEELRQRMQAAVEAERAQARERGGQPDQAAVRPQPPPSPTPADDDVTVPAVNGGTRAVNGHGKPAAAAGVQVRSRRPPAPEPAADEKVTGRLGHAVSSQTGRAQPAGTSPAVPRGQAAPPGRGAKAKPRRRGRRIWLALLAAVLVTGSLAIVSVRYFTRPPASTAAQLREQAAVRDRAAAWVAQQVSRNVTVSCDQAMCRVLSARGFPAHDLLVLGPTSADPEDSDVVVETSVVHDLFGSSLASASAPAVLASFGSGAAAVTVRVVARHGAASYQAAVRADQADRKTAGAALLNDNKIVVSDVARQQLASGRVDSRLVLAIASLVTARPVDVVQFGNIGPGADSSIPLRYADLAENDQAAHMDRAAYVQATRASLAKLTGPFRPASTMTVTLPGGRPALRVEFTAPSPLGLLGPQTSP